MPITTMAIRTRISAYSTRPWPSSLAKKLRIIVELPLINNCLAQLPLVITILTLRKIRAAQQMPKDHVSWSATLWSIRKPLKGTHYDSANQHRRHWRRQHQRDLPAGGQNLRHSQHCCLRG